MAIILIYWDGKIHVNVLRLVRSRGATAEYLTGLLITTLDEMGVDPKKMVAFSADTCNVMFGARSGVTTRLRAKNEHIFNVRCACHSIHLCSSKACKRLPEKVIYLI